MLVVFSGPSASGKGSIIKAIMERDPTFRFSISHTTRAPRPGEVNGVDYHFVTDEEFDKILHEGKFIEFAPVHNRRYGTHQDEVCKALEGPCDVVLDIDHKGFKKLKERIGSLHNLFSIFILPPSRQELEKRMRARSPEMDEGDLALRILNAQTEIDHAGPYDGWIVNSDLQRAVEDAIELIDVFRRGEKPDQRKFRYPPVLEEALKEFRV